MSDTVREYLFDVKLWAVVHVKAKSEEEARNKMRDQLSELTINHDHDGLALHSLCVEDVDNDELVEIDGEAV